MELRDWITISSAIIVVIGWYVVSARARKNEIAKELRAYRLEMLRSFITIINYLNDFDKNDSSLKEKLRNLLELVAATRTKFLMYGYDDEVEAYENLVRELESSDRKNERLTQYVNTLGAIVGNRIRKELDLPAHKWERKS